MTRKEFTIVEMNSIKHRSDLERQADKNWHASAWDYPPDLDYMQKAYYLAALQRVAREYESDSKAIPDSMLRSLQEEYPNEELGQDILGMTDYMDATAERFSYDFSEGCTYSIDALGKVNFRKNLDLDTKLRSLDLSNRDGDPNELSGELSEHDLKVMAEIKRIHPDEDVDKRFLEIQVKNNQQVREFNEWEANQP